jgi:hypothetical protein
LKTLGKLSRRSATTRFAEAPLLPDEDDALVLHGRCTHHIAALHMVRGTMATRRGLSDPTFPPIDLWLLRGLLLVGDPISWRTLCKSRGQPVAFDSGNGRGGISATTHHRQDPDIRPQQQYDDVSRTPGAGDPAQPQGNRKNGTGGGSCWAWRYGHTRQPVTEAKPPESDASRKGTTRAMKARLLDETVHCDQLAADADADLENLDSSCRQYILAQ